MCVIWRVRKGGGGRMGGVEMFLGWGVVVGW